MILIQLITFLFWLLFIPVIVGELIVRICKMERSIFLYYMAGILLEWAVFELICVPCIQIKTGLRLVTYIWCLIMLFLAGANLLMWKKKRKSINWRQWLIGNLQLHKGEVVLMFLVMVFIAFQMYHVFFEQHIDADDARFVANAVAAWDTDHMLLVHPNTGELKEAPFGELEKDAVSPFMIYYAMLARLVSIHPTILAHTVLPVVFLAMGYLAYWLLAMELTDSNVSRSLLIVLLICFINIFGYYSKYANNSFFMIRLWQGKSVVAGILLPFLMYLLLWIQRNFDNLYVYLFLAVCTCAGCLLSGMGLILTAIMVASFLCVYALQQKKIKQLFLGAVACIPNIIFGILYIR